MADQGREVDELSLKILGEALDLIMKLNTREAKVAGLRCFVRGTKHLPPIEADLELIDIDQHGVAS